MSHSLHCNKTQGRWAQSLVAEASFYTVCVTKIITLVTGCWFLFCCYTSFDHNFIQEVFIVTYSLFQKKSYLLLKDGLKERWLQLYHSVITWEKCGKAQRNAGTEIWRWDETTVCALSGSTPIRQSLAVTNACRWRDAADGGVLLFALLQRQGE